MIVNSSVSTSNNMNNTNNSSPSQINKQIDKKLNDNSFTKEGVRNSKSPQRKQYSPQKCVANSGGGLTQSLIYQQFANSLQKNYNKFDLKTDIVCHKNKHENSKITYICVQDGCKEPKKLGCAHCFLDEHFSYSFKDNKPTRIAHSKMRIEEFQSKLQSHFENLSKKNFSSVTLSLKVENSNINVYDRISQDCEELKKLYCRRIDQLKSLTLEKIDLQLGKINSKKLHDELFQVQLQDQQLMNKNIFEMTIQEVNTCLNIYQQKEIDYSEAQYQDQYQSKLSTVLDFAQQLFSKWNDVYREFRKQYDDFAKIDFEVPLILFPLSKDEQMLQNMKFQQQFNNEQQQYKQEAEENQKQELIKLKKEYMHKLEIMATYRATCNHFPNSSLLCVFQCCKNSCAYPCPECHNRLEQHPIQYSNPSIRFCLKCLEFFFAECSQSQHVYCPDCELN